MTTTRELTHEDTAPYVGRVLLAVKDADELAFTTALQDAQAAGVDPVALAVVLAQALVVHMDRANAGWPAQVRQGLADIVTRA